MSNGGSSSSRSEILDGINQRRKLAKLILFMNPGKPKPSNIKGIRSESSVSSSPKYCTVQKLLGP